MKRKIFSVFFALVLVLSLTLVMAAPAGASPGTLNVRPYTLDTGVVWSTEQTPTGSHSVKFVAASDCVDFIPLTGTTLGNLSTISTGWSWLYNSNGIGPGLELRFAGPNILTTNEHIDITVNTAELSPVGTQVWTNEPVTSTSTATCYGNNSTGVEFADSFAPGESWVCSTGNNSLADIVSIVTGYTGLGDAGDWPLTRVRAEIYATGTVYIDDIIIAGTTYYGSIQDAIDSAAATGDEIKVYPGTYTEDLAINEEVTLTGVTAAGADNWTALTAGAGATAPTITYDTNAHMIGIDADNVTIQGFTIDLDNSASRGIHFRSQGAGTIASPTIQYNTFEQAGGDRAISISDDRIVNDFTITYNRFTGDGSAMGNWVAIGEDAGCSGANVISHNITTLLTNAPLLLGSRNIEDITFSNNTLSRSIYLSGEQTPLAYFGDIVVERNTFSFIAVDILSSLDDTDFEGGAFDALDVIVNYNVFPTDTVLSTSKAIYFDVATPSANLDARYNYWGAATGPDDFGDKNPYFAQAETADAAECTVGVDFIPWMIHTDLVSGWNVYSTPIACGDTTDTITEALDFWTDDTATASYYFDGSSQAFAVATSLTPLQAVYLDMTAAATIDVISSTSHIAPPSQTAHDGWNLIGLAELYSMSAEDAIASAYYVAGANNIGYSQVVSPGLGQTAWSAMRGATIDAVSGETMAPCEGYWMNMVNQGILAGFTSTPITELP